MNLRTRMLMSAALLAGLAPTVRATTETYSIDPVHSAVGFSIRHFVAKVPGTFTKFSGTITVDRENLENSKAEATIDAASINTSNQRRDDHLRNPEFLDVQKYPNIAFKSKSWKKTGENKFDIIGDLTIKDVTKEVTLKAELLGFGEGMRGAQLAGWEASTTINKAEFNVKDPAMLDPAIGNDVTITINIEAQKK